MYDVRSLRRVEQVHRRRLDDRPHDLWARGQLALCLFQQALHLACRESSRVVADQACTGDPERASNILRDIMKEDRDGLVAEALNHAEIIQKLSNSAGDHADILVFGSLIEAVMGWRPGETRQKMGEAAASDRLDELAADILGPGRRVLEDFCRSD